MSRHNTPITEGLEAYIREVSLREPAPLQRLREATENHPNASMQISPEQGQFLQFLVRLTGARKILEVGVFMGYSSSWMALAMPAGGKIVACDVSEEFTTIARRTWQETGVAGKIELRLAPALETLDSLIAAGEAGTFDFAFIDADKRNYPNYYERALRLLRPGGLLAADNVLWHGDVCNPAVTGPDPDAIRAFNRQLHHDDRIALTLATIGDGLTLACKL